MISVLWKSFLDRNMNGIKNSEFSASRKQKTDKNSHGLSKLLCLIEWLVNFVKLKRTGHLCENYVLILCGVLETYWFQIQLNKSFFKLFHYHCRISFSIDYFNKLCGISFVICNEIKERGFDILFVVCWIFISMSRHLLNDC